MQFLAAIFSLLVAAAGWFYLFYSRAAVNLGAVENLETNQLRIRLRRIGGGAMILLAVAFYVGCAVLLRYDLGLFAGMMFLVLLLMAVILALGLADLRLTRKVQRTKKDRPE